MSLSAPASALVVGQVTHRRLRPARHRLRYRVFSLLLDLDELPALHARLRLFSLDRFNLLSLWQRDHGPGDGTPLRTYVDAQLTRAGLAPGGQVLMLAMPRLLGHVFNPLSVFFCHRADGRLQAILYEVHNTFGERHTYLLATDGPGAPDGRVRQRCAKGFHVSPFLGMDMDYAFSVTPPRGDGEPVAIAMQVADAAGVVLHASFQGRCRALDDRSLLRAVAAHPLLTLKVVLAIRWEALRLWLKRVPVHPHPASRHG